MQVCGEPPTEEDEGYVSETALEELAKMAEDDEPEPDSGEDDSPPSPGTQAMMSAGRAAVMMHEFERAAMMACADNDGDED